MVSLLSWWAVVVVVGCNGSGGPRIAQRGLFVNIDKSTVSTPPTR